MMDCEDEEDWSKPIEPLNNEIKHNDQWKSGDHPYVILHIDIDCFYAQVEMIRNPELKNKPLGIQQKYIIVTCNYVARERGLTKLMTVRDAKEKCPELVMVNGEDLTNYRNTSYKISNYLQKYTPLVERLGFDENFLDITELVNDRINREGDMCPTEVKGHIFSETDYKKGYCTCGCYARLVVGSHIAAEIRSGLLKELGITCCAGIAHNKLLSKLVAGTHKPNQQTTLFVEDVNHLMSSLTSVRNIQGIGHTTARRLRELGVETVTDVQRVDISVLEEEFGKLPAQTMKKLCEGVDDSPVIAFGLPQTLSDEDSFKKCSDVNDAKAKIKQLINSLLQRLIEDGRRPQTLRLSIRRMSETNRYSNRESRQCPIPAAVFNKFSTENFPESRGQLEVLAFNLFTKMVNIKAPFHLTLINVAFTKLEQKSSSNDISSFFSPKKSSHPKTVTCDSVTRVCESTSKQNSESASKQNSESTTKQNSKSLNSGNIKTKEINISYDTNKLGKNDTLKCGKRNNGPGLQNWFLKMQAQNKQEQIGVVCKSLMGSDLSLTDNEQCVNEFDKNKACKRLASEIDNVRKEHLAKRIRIGDNCDNGYDNSDMTSCLPEGVDVDVFLELPPDIQKDILTNMAYQTNLQVTNSSRRSENINTCPKKILYNENSSTTCTVSQSGCSYMNLNSSMGTKSSKTKSYTCSRQLESENSIPSSSKVLSVNIPAKKRDVQYSGINFHQRQSLESCYKDLDSGAHQCKDPLTETSTIPQDIDPDIFDSLPPDIQQELKQQWKHGKHEKPISSKPVNICNNNRQNKFSFKSPKPSTSSNIRDYFPKKS